MYFCCCCVGIGRGGESTGIKERTMADWELVEYRRELESQNIRNKNNNENY